MKRLRVALICDFAEERWPSMDLVADMLVQSLRTERPDLQVTFIRPRFVRLLTRYSVFRGKTAAFNGDRLLNRFVHYPHVLRRLRSEFDLFHVLDHSYSHLVNHLPAASTVVTCHDLDTFSSILEPRRTRRSWLFRVMTRAIAAGLSRAAKVACVSDSTRAALLQSNLVSPERALTIRNGIHPAFCASADPSAERAAELLLASPEGSIDLLHVGSTIPRKRIDVLLRVFAELRKALPTVRLIQVGGSLTDGQTALAASLGVSSSLVDAPFIDTTTLAAIYRRAALLLMPSESEGFGLPVVEAMASGTPVLASDIPALREVGADAVEYAPVNDVPAWVAKADAMLSERREEPSRWSRRQAAGRERARDFSWTESAARFAALYHELAG